MAKGGKEGERGSSPCCLLLLAFVDLKRSFRVIDGWEDRREKERVVERGGRSKA